VFSTVNLEPMIHSWVPVLLELLPWHARLINSVTIEILSFFQRAMLCPRRFHVTLTMSGAAGMFLVPPAMMTCCSLFDHLDAATFI